MMQTEIQWVLFIFVTALIVFCITNAYRVGYKKGFKQGASVVLTSWKETLYEEEELNEKE